MHVLKKYLMLYMTSFLRKDAHVPYMICMHACNCDHSVLREAGSTLVTNVYMWMGHVQCHASYARTGMMI